MISPRRTPPPCLLRCLRFRSAIFPCLSTLSSGAPHHPWPPRRTINSHRLAVDGWQAALAVVEARRVEMWVTRRMEELGGVTRPVAVLVEALEAGAEGELDVERRACVQADPDRVVEPARKMT